MQQQPRLRTSRCGHELGISTVGLFLPKLQHVGLDTAVRAGRGRGPGREQRRRVRASRSRRRETWPDRRAELADAVDAAAALDAGCLFVTAGVPGPLSWDECVAALSEAIGAGPRPGRATRPVRSRSSTRTRCDATSASSTRLRDMVEVARQLDLGVVVELTNCWSERGRGGHDRRRRRHVPGRAAERLRRRDAHRHRARRSR